MYSYPKMKQAHIENAYILIVFCFFVLFCFFTERYLVDQQTPPTSPGSDQTEISMTLYEPRQEKNGICICENKAADQLLRSNSTADQRLCFLTQIVQSLFVLNSKFQASSQFCGCTVRFVSDLVGSPIDRFSRDAAHIYICTEFLFIPPCYNVIFISNVLDLLFSDSFSLLGHRFSALPNDKEKVRKENF